MPFDYHARVKRARISDCDISFVDEGEGPPLLLIHGVGGSMDNWAPTIAHFSGSCRVIALDLPCHARSGVIETDGSLDFYSGAARGLLAELGIERASIVGNSLGGLITIHIALHHPEVVESIVLVDNAGAHRFPWILDWGLRRLSARVIKKVILLTHSYMARVGFLHRFAGIYVDNEYTRRLIDQAVAVASRHDLDGYLEAYMMTAKTAVAVDYSDRLCEIKVPTLIVWGQKDLGIPLKVGQAENGRIEGSFLVAIPEAAHVPQLDQPELFNEAVGRFLRGASGARDAEWAGEPGPVVT